MPPTTQATPAGGRRMDLRAIALRGQARETALKKAEEELDAVADELIDAGDFANVTLAADLAGVSRSTLYRRIELRQAARKAAA